ncbi:MAG: flagellar biosynthesis anti-sigma factor FlgM [Deltaproteobacteria bacterium]|jgi:negative regulator of flagellin synthesis FlgM|nr:flagellar biosynthesis anti-sigma factor FlgM [Deltaproteobacteria bacterium]
MEIKKTLIRNADPYQTGLDKTQTLAARRATLAGAEHALKSSGDVVTVSPEAALLTQAHRATGAAPDIRQEKVKDIKERIASGAYEPDSRSIARKLLESEVFLAGALKE